MLGNDLLPLLVLALSGAMFLGNVLALVRPPQQARAGDLARAPRGRTVLMAAIGLLASIWAIASLITT